jgi:hypothetical protein
MAYAIADQKSSLTVFNFRFVVESGVLLQRI